jgi:cholesterol transport system auxiliary component
MKFRLIFISICATFLLSGCSLFGPVQGPTKTYVINTIPQVGTKPKSAVTLLVSAVDADPIYNTTQMVYTEHSHQVSYFAKSSWAETPAQMLQPLLIQTLENTHHFHAVTSSAVGRAGYILNTQIIELKQVFFPCDSEIHLKLRAQIINAATFEIVATKEIVVTEPAPQRNPYGGVVAANRAVKSALKQLANFCLRVL